MSAVITQFYQRYFPTSRASASASPSAQPADQFSNAAAHAGADNAANPPLQLPDAIAKSPAARRQVIMGNSAVALGVVVGVGIALGAAVAVAAVIAGSSVVLPIHLIPTMLLTLQFAVVSYMLIHVGTNCREAPHKAARLYDARMDAATVERLVNGVSGWTTRAAVDYALNTDWHLNADKFNSATAQDAMLLLRHLADEKCLSDEAVQQAVSSAQKTMAYIDEKFKCQDPHDKAAANALSLLEHLDGDNHALRSAIAQDQREKLADTLRTIHENPRYKVMRCRHDIGGRAASLLVSLHDL